MKQININQFIGVGILTAFSIFSVFIANAAHFSGDKIQKEESWFNTEYRCKAEALVPVTSKTKGETVMELQNCFRFLNESYVHMDGIWDRELRKSVKWFYKHFLGKKSNGKKFDQAAVGRMRELAALAEPFFPAESETPAGEEIQEETTSEDLDTETQNAKYNVEGNFNSIGGWRETIQNCPAEIRKQIAFFYEGFELTPQEQTQYEAELAAYDKEFQNAASEFDTFARQSQEAYDARNYKEAETLANKMVEVLGQAGKRCDTYKIEPSKVYKQKELVLQKEQHAQGNARDAEIAAKQKEDVRLGQETLEKIFGYFGFTVPSGYVALRSLHDAENMVFAVDLIPKNTESWVDEENQTHYYDHPIIKVMVTSVFEEYTFKIFEKEITSGEGIIGKGAGENSGIKAKKIMLGGIPWYRVIESKAPTFGKDRAVIPVRVSTFYNGFIYTIELGEGSEPEPNTLKQVRGDFEKMIKTLSVRDAASKIEPAVGPLTKEQLLLQGSWQQTETLFPDDLGIGHPPVKAHLIAFRTNKICSFIQEDDARKCYTKYVPFELKNNILIFKESGEEKRWEILKNTASELEIVYQNGYQNGVKDIFRKTSSETPPGR